MAPFFQKLRKLLQSSREDYLTEILAFALQQDILFRERFLALLPLGYQERDGFYVETQSVYSADKRRTDLEINLGHAYIMVECKVNSKESTDQLDDYALLLAGKGHEKRLLVFLTVNREDKEKEYSELGLDFLYLRWHKLGACFIPDSSIITKELKEYLLAEKILMEKITYRDIVTFQSFFETRQKLNDLLQSDVTRMVTQAGLHLYNTWQASVRSNEYVLPFNYGQNTNICLGFGNWWGEHPCLFTRLWLSKRKYQDGTIARAIHGKLKDSGWYLVETNPDGYLVEYRQPLMDFLAYEEDQRERMAKFFHKCVQDLAKIKPDFPTVFQDSVKPIEISEA